MRAIKQGHADWDLNTIRGHGKPVHVKGIFDEKGKIEEISLKNKREVSKWGKYENALKKYRKGDTDALKPFVGKSYLLADGTKKQFISDFDTLYQLDRAEQLPSGDEISLSSRAA